MKSDFGEVVQNFKLNIFEDAPKGTPNVREYVVQFNLL